MNNRSDSRRSPEEIELANKLTELEALETALVQEELELATLTGEVAAFNSRYLNSVGRLFAELDDVEREIAELRASLNPHDSAAGNAAMHARQRASESTWAVNEARQAVAEFKPTAEIKQLYRDAARRFHPDRALDDEDRARRNEIMAKINVAYQNNDLAGLQRLIEEIGHLPDEIKGENLAAKLIRAIRSIALVKSRMGALDAEIVKIKSSDIFLLKLKVEGEEVAGGDPLGDLARQLTHEIVKARGTFAAMQAAKRRTAEQANTRANASLQGVANSEMTVARAEAIVSAYSKILEDTKGPIPGVTVADASELPFSKEAIRQALILLIRRTRNSKLREHLKIGYRFLADWQSGVGPVHLGFNPAEVDFSQGAFEIAKQHLAAEKAAQKWLAVANAERKILERELEVLEL